MKRIIKLTLVVLMIALAMSLVSCAAIERIFLGGDDYAITDIVLTQVGIDEFEIAFTANTGRDKADVYLTEGFRLLESSKPKEVEKVVDGRKVRYSFTQRLNLGEDYYLWLVYGDKEAKVSITSPSMFPSIAMNDDGSATFEFKYTYGTPWGSFCDPTGKSVYVSDKPIFDDSAVLIQSGIDITEEKCIVPSDKVSESKYYYSVSVAKEGSLKIISRPVRFFNDLSGQVEGITANVTADPLFTLALDIPESAAMAGEIEDKLQLVIKTDMADEIYVLDFDYADGKATVSFDYTNLQYDGLWYDVLLAWDGAIVMDVPRNFGGHAIEIAPSVKKDGTVYAITGWKPENAPASAEILKIYFEYDTTRYADELLRGYLVSLNVEGVTALNVKVTLRQGQTTAPTLAITAGDTNKIVSVEGILQDDGTYLYILPVEEALVAEDVWYDLRFFVGNTPYEMLKDSCITYTDFATKYQVDDRIYEFREWNGFLKLMFTYIVLEG